MASEKWIKDAEVEGDSLRNKYFKEERAAETGSRTEKSEGQETLTGPFETEGLLVPPPGEHCSGGIKAIGCGKTSSGPCVH